MPCFAYRFATVSDQNFHWFLQHSCSVTPAQPGWMYASLCAASLGTGSLFWWYGAKLVMPFAWLELVAVGAAFLAYARHATDGERIVLEVASPVVERETAGRRSGQSSSGSGFGWSRRWATGR